jgi:type 1 fimbria pilin
MRRRVLLSLTALLLALSPLSAQDGLGFGDEEAGGASGGSAAPAVSIGGEVSASMTGFVDEFSDGAEEVRLGDIFSGKLNFSAETSSASGIINLKLCPTSQPLEIDEAYIRAWFGSFDVEGGCGSGSAQALS